MKNVWILVFTITILRLLLFDITILNSPESVQAQFIPDDGYGYLSLARNFCNLGYWTFDSGNSLTSGFHLLLAYILSLLYYIFKPDNSHFVRFGIILTSAIILFLPLFAVFHYVQSKRWQILAASALVMSSIAFTHNSVCLMDYSLALACSVLYIWYVYRNDLLLYKRIHRVVLFLIAFAGSLARSDFGVMPFAFFLAGVVVFFSHKQKEYLNHLFWGLLGAVCGVIFMMIHNFMFTGSFLQNSAKVKFFWAKVGGFDCLPVISNIFSSIGIYGFELRRLGLMLSYPQKILLILIFMLGVVLFYTAGVLLFYGKKNGIKELIRIGNLRRYDAKNVIVVAASGIAILSYIGFYSMDGGLQEWNSVNTIVPLIVLLSFMLSIQKSRKLQCVLIAVFILSILKQFLYVANTPPPYPHQKYMYMAGRYLNRNKLKGKIGSWNANIINFYEGGHVINIDGLLNDDIYNFLIEKNLICYIKRKNIVYLVDFKQMFLDEKLQARGGYNGAIFLKNSYPLKVFDKDADCSGQLALYKIDLEKINGIVRCP